MKQSVNDKIFFMVCFAPGIDIPTALLLYIDENGLAHR
jgi:hypothetical protein